MTKHRSGRRRGVPGERAKASGADRPGMCFFCFKKDGELRWLTLPGFPACRQFGCCPACQSRGPEWLAREVEKNDLAKLVLDAEHRLGKEKAHALPEVQRALDRVMEMDGWTVHDGRWPSECWPDREEDSIKEEGR